ncbi:LOW QUALITY PROTEIN: luciferin 4-monooxygenase-like [Aphomia sociella]
MIKNPLYVYGEGDVNLPVNLNFGEYFLKSAWQFKDKPAFINAATHEIYTFGRMVQDSMNVAVSLTHMGVRKGDVIAICTENRTEFWSAVLGTVCTGAILSTVNPGYTADELKHILGISKPKYTFCSTSFYESHEKTLKSLPYIKKIILIGDKNASDVILFKNLRTPIPDAVNSDIIVNGRLTRNVRYDEFNAVDVSGQTDVMFILYSSGTTGLPKGVMLTHLNVIASCCLPKSLDANVAGLTITPWYHTMGLIGTSTALVSGRTMVYLPKFEVDLYLRTIEKYKISQLTVVPPVLIAVKSQTSYDLSSVQLVYSGGAPLQNDTISIVKTNYMAEIQPIVDSGGQIDAAYFDFRKAFDLVNNDTLLKKLAEVVDIETRRPLGPNQHGELCFKGPLLMKGYVGKSKEDDFDEEGFFKSGDIGYYDEEKHFFIVDRLKELIKYKAYQVPPAEIEALLLQHEAVMDAAVVGLKSKESGEVPLAFVVKRPGKTVTEKEIQSFVAERLSNPKRLRGGVRFVAAIPKNPSGKILRRELRKMASQISSKL